MKSSNSQYSDAIPSMNIERGQKMEMSQFGYRFNCLS